MSRRFPVLGTRSLLAIGDGENKEGEPEGVGVEATVAPGFKREFKPWFVLKPEEPEGAKKVREGLRAGVAVGADAEAQRGTQQGPARTFGWRQVRRPMGRSPRQHPGGAELSAGLKLKWEAVRFPRVK
jgi:hypothetical protein